MSYQNLRTMQMKDRPTSELVVGSGRGGTALALEPELVEALGEVVGAARSDNTKRAYATQIRKFEAWCARRSTSALPATPAVVAIYLVDLAQAGAKVATVGLALSAISASHRLAGVTFDTRSREIAEAIKGIRRLFAAPQVQAEPLRPAMIRDMLARLGDSNAALDRRDAAIVALLFAAALRRSELAGLDFAQAASGDGYLALTHEAVEIVLLRSKARTEPVVVKIPRVENAGLVAAIERWVAVAGIAPGEPHARPPNLHAIIASIHVSGIGASGHW